MSNSDKSLADRIAILQQHCNTCHLNLSFNFNYQTNEWSCTVDGEDMGEVSDDFEELLSGVEAEQYL